MSGRGEEVSITGTAITRIPLTGRPEFAGLMVDDDTAPIARVEDGALMLDIPNRELAEAWRNAFQQAVDHYDARAKADTLRQNGMPAADAAQVRENDLAALRVDAPAAAMRCPHRDLDDPTYCPACDGSKS